MNTTNKSREIMDDAACIIFDELPDEHKWMAHILMTIFYHIQFLGDFSVETEDDRTTISIVLVNDRVLMGAE